MLSLPWLPSGVGLYDAGVRGAGVFSCGAEVDALLTAKGRDGLLDSRRLTGGETRGAAIGDGLRGRFVPSVVLDSMCALREGLAMAIADVLLEELPAAFAERFGRMLLEDDELKFRVVIGTSFLTLAGGASRMPVATTRECAGGAFGLLASRTTAVITSRDRAGAGTISGSIAADRQFDYRWTYSSHRLPSRPSPSL